MILTMKDGTSTRLDLDSLPIDIRAGKGQPAVMVLMTTKLFMCLEISARNQEPTTNNSFYDFYDCSICMIINT